ncbi:MAG: argininosuccinate lyase [Dehalococcoidia bacterium]|nr:argininosuccinate lyase [Dehalococcoidia bacterium]
MRQTATARPPTPASNGAAKPWGGRFDAQTHELVEDYTSSVAEDGRLLPFDIMASVAHARMLGRQGIIMEPEAQRIVAGLHSVWEEFESGKRSLRPDLEDVHMNVEVRLAEKIGAVAGKLHTARSRNDQVATDFRLYVMDAAEETVSRLLELQSALLTLAETHRAVIIPGYTHLQRAQPVLLAHHLLAYVQMFRRDQGRIGLAAVEAANEMPLGSGALAGVPYPVDRASVADELGFLGISENSIDAVSDRDFVVDFIMGCALAMVHVSRLAEEIVLWSSGEFAFIRLPDAFATGSSIMPQKKNPDVAELARGRTGRVIGALTNILITLKGLPLAYNRDLQEDKRALFDAQDTLDETLEVLAAMLPRIEVDAARARKAATANYALATDYADYLVRKGVPFRSAHEAVGKLVREAEERGVADLRRLSLDDLRRFAPEFDEDARAIDLMSSLRSRDAPGGTAPRRVAAALRQERRRVEAQLGAVNRRYEE